MIATDGAAPGTAPVKSQIRSGGRRVTSNGPFMELQYHTARDSGLRFNTVLSLFLPMDYPDTR